MPEQTPINITNTAPIALLPLPPRKKARSKAVPPTITGAYQATLTSLGGQAMRVTLSEPADGEVCPLTLSPIAEDALDFIPDQSFFPALPAVRRMTLPCGHAFGALSIVYLFARRTMRCPCCRSGHNSGLRVDSIPVHIRAEVMSKVDAECLRDLEEQDTGDAAFARELAGARAFSLIAVQFDSIYLSIYYHDSAHPVPSFGMQFRLHTHAEDTVINDSGAIVGDPNNPILFQLPFNERRQLALHASEFPPERISLVAHTRTFGDIAIELARTEPFAMAAPQPHTGRNPAYAAPRVVAAGGSQFEVYQITNPYTNRFICWRIPCEALVHRMIPSLVIEVD
jgi:hypothetical protein